jgi:hypothetical protein
MLGKVDFPADIQGRFFALRTVAAPRVQVGSTTVATVAKVVAVKGLGSVFIRSGPAAILVSANGQVSRVRVRDMTRVAQAVIVGLTALGTSCLVARANSRKEPQP